MTPPPTAARLPASGRRRAATPPTPHATAHPLGGRAAAAVAAIGAAYLVVLAAGVLQVGLAAPIRDPVLAVMEALTLLSALAILAVMAALHGRTSPERRVFATLALALATVFAGLTSAVHFVGLTASRQLGRAELAWPSAAYAVELLAWDWFLGLALLAAAAHFGPAGEERTLRRLFVASGALSLLGTAGPLAGDMALQRIGIVGYAVVLPVAFARLARHLGVRARRPPS